MDNHGSHLTYEFIEYCENNQILLYTLPPHTTHILQPLDGKPFQQYKHYHAKAVNNAARWGECAFEKRQFLEELPGIRRNTFKSQTIKSGFAERGIYPFNPDPTLETLEKRMIPVPDLQIWTGDRDAEGNSPPPPSTPSSDASSPKNIQKLRHHISKAERSLGEIKHIVNNASPGLTNRIEKVFSGSLMQAELRAQHEDDLDSFHLAAKRQNRPRSRRQVQSLSSTGVLSVKDANHHIEARKEEEDQGMRRRAVKRGARFRTNQTPTDENDPRMERIPVEDGDDVFFWIDK